MSEKGGTHTYKWNAWHQQGGNERAENTSLGPIVQTVPSEHIEIARSVHVAGIDLACERVDKIVLHEHFVPCADEIYCDVVGDLQVTVHSEKTLE